MVASGVVPYATVPTPPLPSDGTPNSICSDNWQTHTQQQHQQQLKGAGLLPDPTEGRRGDEMNEKERRSSEMGNSQRMQQKRFHSLASLLFLRSISPVHSSAASQSSSQSLSSSSSSSSSSTSNFSTPSASAHAEVLNKTQTLSCSPLKLMQRISPINPSPLPRVPLQPSSVPTRWNSSVLSSSASVNHFSSASASFSTSEKRPVQTQT